MTVTRRALRNATGHPDQLADLLDQLAAEAAADSNGAAPGRPDGSDRDDDRDGEALDTLLWAVDRLSLGRGVVQRLVLNEPDVDDVVQDILVAVAETIGSFRGDARFTTWLHQVARFKAIAHLRRKRDESGFGESQHNLPDAVRVSSLLAGEDHLHNLLSTLPEYYRDAVRLRDVDRLPYDQVARQLGISPGTAKSRVARGRALVAAHLAR